MPKEARLRKPAEFRKVYSGGRRFDGFFMTLFLMPSDAGNHRIGITASKKAIGNAVSRNRAKRLLREAFRLSRPEIEMLGGRYDWVLNAKRQLLGVKLKEPLRDFRQLVKKVKSSEAISGKGGEAQVNESK